MIIEAWGGGGRGGYVTDLSGYQTVASGLPTATTVVGGVLNLSAGPGGDGLYNQPAFLYDTTGGTGSGGDVNLTGEGALKAVLSGGSYSRGAAAPDGDLITGGSDGNPPGGGGDGRPFVVNGGVDYWGVGGGGAGYTKKTTTPDTVPSGTSLTITVGQGGFYYGTSQYGGGSTYFGHDSWGGDGMVVIRIS